ncbi:hypothetical protein Tco_0684797 [Tanacetum coccineum]
MDVIACSYGMYVIACLYGMDVIACLHDMDVIACLHGMNVIACLHGMYVIPCLHGKRFSLCKSMVKWRSLTGKGQVSFEKVSEIGFKARKDNIKNEKD